jgi:hypothetical protein
MDRWELKYEQDRMKGKSQAVVMRVKRLLMKPGKDAPLL